MPHATRPGDVVGGRYRLVDLLSESDGGRFWRAHDPVLGRHVAIHVIAGDDARAPALMEAARRSAAVPDRRVLRVLDAECTETECYVVNEWGTGTSLDIVVAGRAPLEPRRAAWLVAEVADSVAAAHAVGVAHGRLNPENVLVDRAGDVRLIGLGVDAALHGVATDAVDRAAAHQRDVEDLAGLLYCALTARWPGPSSSAVPAAPRAHGQLLRLRQVRAGVPRPLDQLCEAALHRTGGARHREPVGSARDLADQLLAFVGDPDGMPAALLDAVPDVLPEEEQVVLPPVPEAPPHDPPADPVDERPTEAGVPIFGDDDVSWLARRQTPPPPPPPFEAPPERPLFALDADGRTPQRTVRVAVPSPAASGPDRADTGDDSGFWPWDTGTGAPTGKDGPIAPDAALDAAPDGTDRPGRGFLRLATVLALVVLLALAVVVAVTTRGDADDRDAASGPAGPAGRPVAAVTGARPTVTVLDPRSDSSGAAPDAHLVVDGEPATVWRTDAYDAQLGSSGGAASGVGLVLDLGAARPVGRVSLTLVGTPASVSLYVVDDRPASVEGLDPVAQGSSDGPRLTLDAAGTRGSHVVVWFTALPIDPLDPAGRFRGTVAEVRVQAGRVGG